MVDIMDKVQKITEINKSTREKQEFINVSEVFYVWDILVTKLDIKQTVQIEENLIQDTDLKFISGQLLKGLEEGIREMEELMKNYGIPFPMRPPAGSNTTSNLEHLTDRDILRLFLKEFSHFSPFFPVLL